MLVGSLTKDKLQANLVKAGLCAGGEEEEQHLVWGLKISPKKMQKQWIFSFLFLSWIKYYFFTVMAECVDVLFINAVQKKKTIVWRMGLLNAWEVKQQLELTNKIHFVVLVKKEKLRQLLSK